MTPGLPAAYRTYFNAVILYGAAVAGRYDVASQAATHRLLQYQKACGGFGALTSEDEPLAGIEDETLVHIGLSITCMCGMYLLRMGCLPAAAKAAEFVHRMVTLQPDKDHFIFVMNGLDSSLITRPVGWMSDYVRFRITSSEPRQRFYHPGLAVVFLSEMLCSVGGDHATSQTYRDDIQTLIAFCHSCTRDMVSVRHACKVAWGAAYNYRVNGDDKDLSLAKHVVDGVFLKNQKADGSYDDWPAVMMDDGTGPTCSGFELTCEYCYEYFLMGAAIAKPPTPSRP